MRDEAEEELDEEARRRFHQTHTYKKKKGRKDEVWRSSSNIAGGSREGRRLLTTGDDVEQFSINSSASEQLYILLYIFINKLYI